MSCPGCPASISFTLPTGNLIQNPVFANGSLSGWFVQTLTGASTVVNTSTGSQAPYGGNQYQCVMTAPSSASEFHLTAQWASTGGQWLNVSPGQCIVFGGWIYNITGGYSARIEMFTNSAPNGTGTSSFPGAGYTPAITSANSGWQLACNVYAVPATGVASIALKLQLASSGGVVMEAAFDSLFLTVSSQNPPPAIGGSGCSTSSGVNPQSGPVIGGTTVAICGANFQSGATVAFSNVHGSAAGTAVQFISSTQLQCVAPAAPGGAFGPADVKVTNPDAQSATAVGSFTYQAVSVSSSTANTGSNAGGLSVTIRGAGFGLVSGNLSVTFSSYAATSVVAVDDSTLTCTTPSYPGTGLVNVNVRNSVYPLGSDTGVLVNGFTYGSAPHISSVSPTCGLYSGGNTITINGSAFSSGGGTNSVTVGGFACTNVVTSSDSQILATLPAITQPSTPVSSSVVVRNSIFGSSNSVTYTYCPIQITGVSPSCGSSAGGTGITIAGQGLPTSATVQFITSAGTQSVHGSGSSTSITCISPAGSGVATIKVLNANNLSQTSACGGNCSPCGCSGCTACTFTYSALPVISGCTSNNSSCSACCGAAAGGDTLTVKGSNFHANSYVNFGSTQISGSRLIINTSSSPNTISFTVPAGTGGSLVSVSVGNPSTCGSSALTSAPVSFTYNQVSSLQTFTVGVNILGGNNYTRIFPASGLAPIVRLWDTVHVGFPINYNLSNVKSLISSGDASTVNESTSSCTGAGGCGAFNHLISQIKFYHSLGDGKYKIFVQLGHHGWTVHNTTAYPTTSDSLHAYSCSGKSGLYNIGYPHFQAVLNTLADIQTNPGTYGLPTAPIYAVSVLNEPNNTNETCSGYFCATPQVLAHMAHMAYSTIGRGSSLANKILVVGPSTEGNSGLTRTPSSGGYYQAFMSGYGQTLDGPAGQYIDVADHHIYVNPVNGNVYTQAHDAAANMKKYAQPAAYGQTWSHIPTMFWSGEGNNSQTSSSTSACTGSCCGCYLAGSNYSSNCSSSIYGGGYLYGLRDGWNSQSGPSGSTHHASWYAWDLNGTAEAIRLLCSGNNAGLCPNGMTWCQQVAKIVGFTGTYTVCQSGYSCSTTTGCNCG